jgi:hypothetical protein
LVGRIVQLLATRKATLDEIAAITFTEAAAAELRLRLYDALLKSGDEVLVAMSSEIDDATITTIHGFAQRLLAEHPIEAGLPLHFEVADEIASSLAFEERFAAFLDELYDDDAAALLIQALTELGVRPSQLHAFTMALEGSQAFLGQAEGEPRRPASVVVTLVRTGFPGLAGSVISTLGEPISARRVHGGTSALCATHWPPSVTAATRP